MARSKFYYPVTSAVQNSNMGNTAMKATNVKAITLWCAAVAGKGTGMAGVFMRGESLGWLKAHGISEPARNSKGLLPREFEQITPSIY